MNQIVLTTYKKTRNSIIRIWHKRFEIEGLHIIGNAKEKTSVISFNIEGIHRILAQ
jgi:cysteine desulfurase/selenocysteine lyase